MKNSFIILIVMLSTVLFYLSGCSDRIESPVILKDSTIVHPPKIANGISAAIAFSTKIDNETNDLIGTGTLFKIKEDGRVYAKVTLANLDHRTNNDLLFHIDWIDLTGNSFFRKQIILSNADTTTTLNSYISIPPDKREPGRYKFRVYLFREIIAAKYFTLSTTAEKIIDEVLDTIKTSIKLCKRISRKTDKLIGIDSSFVISKKSRVYAVVNLENHKGRGKRELIFYMDWIGPDGISFYTKEINYSPDDTYNIITSSISTSPSKREPGIYNLRVYLFDKLKSEKQFELKKPVKKSK